MEVWVWKVQILKVPLTSEPPSRHRGRSRQRARPVVSTTQHHDNTVGRSTAEYTRCSACRHVVCASRLVGSRSRGRNGVPQGTG